MASPDDGLSGRWQVERDPLRYMITDLSRREKFNQHLIQCSVFPYSYIRLLKFLHDARGSFLYTTVAVVPMLPAVVKISGENNPCPTSLTLSSYARFFSISYFL